MSLFHWLAMLAGPSAAAILAFQTSARAHALDLLLAGAVCGNPANRPEVFTLFGHCMTCWSTGAAAGVATSALMAAMLLRIRGATARPT